MKKVIVVGGGPAGLMAAEVLVSAGMAVDLYDAMPSVGRKFLIAGKGGMNLTHSESSDLFASRFGERRAQIEGLLRSFGSLQLREWAQALGIETFVGSSGRVFPTDMKAAPLLRAWLQRLRHPHRGRACSSTCGTAGSVGRRMAARCASRPPRAKCRHRPMPWCWRSAAAAGRAWARTAPGCRCWLRAAWR
jgi:predicted flavoprotein YhiN